MGSEETPSDRRQPGSDETTNVVRIPRDWFGPQEELVPFGPRAFTGQPQRDAVVADGFAEDDLLLDPNAFWGENATFIHGAVEAPTGRSEPKPAPRRQSIHDVAHLAARHRALSGALAILLIAGLGVWAFHSSSPRAHSLPRAQTMIAATVTSHELEDSRQRAASAARSNVVDGRRPQSRRLIRHRARPRLPIPTPVVYHPSQATYSPPSSVGYSPAVTAPTSPSATTGTTSAGTTGGGTGIATAAAHNATSQPAFGANGALGPVSSPDG